MREEKENYMQKLQKAFERPHPGKRSGKAKKRKRAH